MKNKFSIIVGVLILVLTIGLNVRHALNDYGVKDRKLHVEVLAQGTVTDGTTCYNTITSQDGSKILYCATCTYIDNSTDSWVSGKGSCN